MVFLFSAQIRYTLDRKFRKLFPAGKILARRKDLLWGTLFRGTGLSAVFDIAERQRMNRIQIGDMVAFRREVVGRCGRDGVAAFRGKVTEIAEGWLFLQDACGRRKVMPAASMCKVAPSGVVLQLV
jgi:hypothetical protein